MTAYPQMARHATEQGIDLVGPDGLLYRLKRTSWRPPWKPGHYFAYQGEGRRSDDRPAQPGRRGCQHHRTATRSRAFPRPSTRSVSGPSSFRPAWCSQGTLSRVLGKWGKQSPAITRCGRTSGASSYCSWTTTSNPAGHLQHQRHRIRQRPPPARGQSHVPLPHQAGGPEMPLSRIWGN